MSETDPPHFDSRRWTGDLEQTTRQPYPASPLKPSPINPETMRAIGAPLLFIIVMMAVAWLVQRTPGSFAPDYVVAYSAQYVHALTAINWTTVAALGLFLLSFKFPPSRMVRRLLYLVAIAAALFGFVEFRLVTQAHSSALIVGPRYPMLLISTNDCGGSKRKSRGPCIHDFRLWDGHGAYDVEGYDWPKVWACVTVQRIKDRTGFIWDEVVAREDLRAETDDNGDITQQAQRECVNEPPT